MMESGTEEKTKHYDGQQKRKRKTKGKSYGMCAKCLALTFYTRQFMKPYSLSSVYLTRLSQQLRL
jgi:hypothetical protein